MVEGKKWLLKVVLTCVALSTCPSTHVPWHKHTSAPHVPNIIKRMWKKISKVQGCTIWLRASWTHANPSSCPHPLSPNLKMLPSYKALKFCVSLIHGTLTFFRATKETCSWLLFFSPQFSFDYSLQSVSPSLSPSSNWKYRMTQKCPCRDLNLRLKALTSCKRSMIFGTSRSKPLLLASQLLLFLLVQDEGSCHLFV